MRVLFGDVNLAGRLPVTFPAEASQLQTAGDPMKYPGVAETVNYSEASSPVTSGTTPTPGTDPLPQPPKRLVGYASVNVPADRTISVSGPLNDRSFATWDGSGLRVVAGCYTLGAGSSSRALVVRAVVSRGGACAHAALKLGTSGDFSLPVGVPATATATPLPRSRHSKRRRHSTARKRGR